MTTDEQISLITGITLPERKKLLSWICSLPEEKIIEIFQSTVKKFFQMKDQHSSIPGRTKRYAAFILASRNAGWDSVAGKGYRIASQQQYNDFSSLRQANVAALIKKGRTPLLRRKILAYWGEVKELKNLGMGFRPIADYLAKTRRIKTSATYLARLWREVESNN